MEQVTNLEICNEIMTCRHTGSMRHRDLGGSVTVAQEAGCLVPRGPKRLRRASMRELIRAC